MFYKQERFLKMLEKMRQNYLWKNSFFIKLQVLDLKPFYKKITSVGIWEGLHQGYKYFFAECLLIATFEYLHAQSCWWKYLRKTSRHLEASSLISIPD